jgi:hypothetical protein
MHKARKNLKKAQQRLAAPLSTGPQLNLCYIFVALNPHQETRAAKITFYSSKFFGHALAPAKVVTTKSRF